MKKMCIFCRKRKNIPIITVYDRINNKEHCICHVCFNQAKLCTDGLIYTDRTLRINISPSGVLEMGEEDDTSKTTK